MTVQSADLVLHSRYFPTYRVDVVAKGSGEIRAIVSDCLSSLEVSIKGIPQQINIQNIEEVVEAKFALRQRRICFDSLQVRLDPKLRGGGPPLESDLDRMGNANGSKELSVMEETFIQQLIMTGGPVIGGAVATGSPPVVGAAVVATFLCNYFVNLYKNHKNKTRVKELQDRVNVLEGELKKGGGEAKQGYDAFLNSLRGLLTDAEDRKNVLSELYEGIRTKREEIRNNPVDSTKKLELAALQDCVYMVAAAIPDKKIANHVTKVGEAGISFAKAFLAFKEMGGIAAVAAGGAAGAVALLGPVGFVITGISAICSLVSRSSDQDPIVEVVQEIKKLSEETKQFQQQVNLRFDLLEELLADFRKETLENFKTLKGDIGSLRKLSQEQYRATNLKLDRISASITAGLPAVVSVGLTARKASAKGLMQLGTITNPQADDFLIDFVAWAKDHSINPVFTGALNKSYAPEQVRDVLSSSEPETLLYYLAHHPWCGMDTSIANPYVWADAAEAYMQTRLNTPQFDATYGNNHRPLFLEIYQTGQDLQQFITDLQQNRALFEKLCTEYDTCLSELAAGNQNVQVLARLDAAYHLLTAYSQIAFQQSCKQDILFSSYISKGAKPRLRLVKSEEVQKLLNEANQAKYQPQRDYLKRELFCDLKRSGTYFREALMQKVDEASDSHPLITPMMQRLWDFGNRYFPGDPNFAPSAYPKTYPDHFVDANRIRVNDIFYAIFTGNEVAVDSLLATQHSSKDSLGRTPLHYACATGQLRLVQKLVKAGANINAEDQGAERPVHLARRAKRTDVERWLNANSAKPYIDHWIPGEEEYIKANRYRNSDFSKVFEHIKNAAVLGHVRAQHELARHYFHGGGPLTKNPSEGLKWMLICAAQGYVDAQYDLGCRYMHGTDFPKNIPEAIKWFEKAQAQGNHNATLILAQLKK